MSRCRLTTFLLLCLVAAAAAAEPITASRGRWSGPVGERSSAWPGDGKVELRLDGSADRFTFDVAGPGGSLIAGEFQAGKRKDVFGPPASKGLMSFFGRGSPVNPLEGKPLAWARRAGDELIVYRLDINDGAHRLDRIVLVPAGDRMRVAWNRGKAECRPKSAMPTMSLAAR